MVQFVTLRLHLCRAKVAMMDVLWRNFLSAEFGTVPEGRTLIFVDNEFPHNTV